MDDHRLRHFRKHVLEGVPGHQAPGNVPGAGAAQARDAAAGPRPGVEVRQTLDQVGDAMNWRTKMAVRQVLRESADTPNFFDLCDGERLVRLIAMAFELGRDNAPSPP